MGFDLLTYPHVDGTSIYLTRDIGAAIERYEKYKFDKMIYVISSQQDLHTAQFIKILKLMEFPWADNIEHVNYGLVLGMSTRRGTVVFLDQIQALRDDGVLFELVLPYLHEDLNHVLYTMTDGTLIEYCAEAFKDSRVCLRRVFSEVRADLSHEADRDLNGVVCRAFEEEDKDLEGNDLMSDTLIDEMTDEGSGGVAYSL